MKINTIYPLVLLALLAIVFRPEAWAGPATDELAKVKIPQKAIEQSDLLFSKWLEGGLTKVPADDYSRLREIRRKACETGQLNCIGALPWLAAAVKSSDPADSKFLTLWWDDYFQSLTDRASLNKAVEQLMRANNELNAGQRLALEALFNSSQWQAHNVDVAPIAKWLVKALKDKKSQAAASAYLVKMFEGSPPHRLDLKIKIAEELIQNASLLTPELVQALLPFLAGSLRHDLAFKVLELPIVKGASTSNNNLGSVVLIGACHLGRFALNFSLCETYMQKYQSQMPPAFADLEKGGTLLMAGKFTEAESALTSTHAKATPEQKYSDIIQTFATWYEARLANSRGNPQLASTLLAKNSALVKKLGNTADIDFYTAIEEGRNLRRQGKAPEALTLLIDVDRRHNASGQPLNLIGAMAKIELIKTEIAANQTADVANQIEILKKYVKAGASPAAIESQVSFLAKMDSNKNKTPDWSSLENRMGKNHPDVLDMRASLSNSAPTKTK